MWIDRHGSAALLTLACVAMTACVPRIYSRHTLELQHPDPAALDIHYAPFEGCLLQRQVPVSYRLQRPQYVLRAEVGFASEDDAASLVLSLEGEGALSARFPGLVPAPHRQPLERGYRYRLDTRSIVDGRFNVEVLRDDQVLDRQWFRVQQRHCRALDIDGR